MQSSALSYSNSALTNFLNSCSMVGKLITFPSGLRNLLDTMAYFKTLSAPKSVGEGSIKMNSLGVALPSGSVIKRNPRDVL